MMSDFFGSFLMMMVHLAAPFDTSIFHMSTKVKHNCYRFGFFLSDTFASTKVFAGNLFLNKSMKPCGSMMMVHLAAPFDTSLFHMSNK